MACRPATSTTCEISSWPRTSACPTRRLEGFSASAEHDPYSMRCTVVGEGDLSRALRQGLAVQLDAGYSATDASRVLDGDLVARRAVSIDKLEARPLAWDAWIDQQGFAAQPKAQYPLEARAVHPSRGACVPGPSTAPDVRWHRVDVGARDVGLDFVAMNPGARVRVIDWIQNREQFVRLVPVAEHRKSDHRPQRAM